MTTLIAPGERRRVRVPAMADELGISVRKIRQLLLLGLPHTQVQGVIWCEPAKVHVWLDKFDRKGRAPGVKRVRGIKVPKTSPQLAAAQ